MLCLDALVRPAALQTLAQAFHLGLRLRPVHVRPPAGRTRHRPRVEHGPAFVPLGRARPLPILGMLYQAGTHGIALNIAIHRQQPAILLDGNRAEAPLPNVPAGVVMLAGTKYAVCIAISTRA